MKRIFSLAFVVALSLLATACNTVHGLGKDVERGGEKMQDWSKDAQKK